MKQSGITESNQPVYADVFSLVGTYGLPLEFILQSFKDSGKIIDWPDYISLALADGHKTSTIRERILSACGDVYGPGYAKEVEKRLIPYLSGR